MKANRKETSPGPTLTSEPVGDGRLTITHRPKLKRLPQMAREGVTHIVTLLSRREQAEQIGRAVRAAGMDWIWFPLPNGDPLPDGRIPEMLGTFDQIDEAVRLGGWVLIHCSAGIHRTGMMTYAYLRHRGKDRVRALEQLARIRPVTAEQVGDHRLDWADYWAGS